MVHAVAMAIRMKEWGMMRVPGNAAHVPVQGLMGWGDAARNVGAGISSVLLGSVELAREKERVEEAGELAAFSERLRAIGEETREELAQRDVQDWNYAWREASGPRLAEAVEELPLASRQAGRELAEAYNARASLQALRDRELDKISRSREQWRQRVDAAVEAGDEEQARHWLQQGAGVFVPEGKLGQEEQAVSDKARAAQWRKSLSLSPVQALGDFAAAGKEALPMDAGEVRRLEEEVRKVHRSQKQQLSVALADCVQQELPFDEAELQQAHRAHLLSDAQFSQAQAVPASMEVSDLCRWQQRIDECSDDAGEQADLRLDIATAPLPVLERRRLLGRLDMACRVDRGDRATLSRQLWQLYQQGHFGCPGDALALQRLADLQRDGLPVLAGQGTEASAHWVDALRQGTGRWVCFSSHQDKMSV